MKRLIIIAAYLFVCIAAQAQIKLHSNGRITFQTLSNTTNQGVAIDPSPDCHAHFNGKAYFKDCAYFCRSTNAYQWTNCSKATNNYSKAWVVSFNDYSTTKFYVYGNGNVYGTDYFTLGNTPGSKASQESVAIEGKEALDVISRLNGRYYDPEEQEIPDLENNENVVPEAVEAMYADFEKRSAKLSTEGLEEAFPEAVRTDPQNRACINYQAVVTMLVEAVKEQQTQIEQLQKMLKENELMKQ